MHANVIDNAAIEEGLDRKHLNQLRQRFLAVNSGRLARLQEALNPRQQTFLTLLPLLLHSHHPMLPGYVSQDTPRGIAHYTPSAATLQAAKGVARSFRYRRSRQPLAIHSLFVMGSVGTLAYGRHSDLDIWVCHQPQLDREAKRQLEIKCQLLTDWARSLGLEVHFFLMDPQAFAAGQNQQMSKEASGSTQHYLLLDEFYRTGLWLAGRLPLWWFVPAEREADYPCYREQLLGKRFLRDDSCIDFGPVASIPPQEFVGAAVWQLYKAIESPYKAVLKLLLLETYANEFPQVQPLALTLKTQVYTGQLNINELDPYVLAYRRVEAYLQGRGEWQRLALVRRCFYFKVNKPLTRPPSGSHASWQRQLLQQLVTEWQWTPEELRQLDRRRQWKAAAVVAETQLLVRELHSSYRLLLGLAERAGCSPAQSGQELQVLARKLQANYERRPGKLEWLNPQIADDLWEPALTLVEWAEANREGWQVHPQSLREYRQQPSPALKQTHSLLELLLWCQANGLLTAASQLDCLGTLSDLDGDKLRQLTQQLQAWLQQSPQPAPHHAFSTPARPRRLLVWINLATTPTLVNGLERMDMQLPGWRASDLGEQRLATLDVVTENSWGEILCQRFHQAPLLNGLNYLLRQLLATPEPVQLAVHCHTAGVGLALQQRVQTLVEQLQQQLSDGARSLFSDGDVWYLADAEQTPMVRCFASESALLEHLSSPRLRYQPLVADLHLQCHAPLQLLADVSSEEAIHVIFSPRGQVAEILGLDSQGTLFQGQLAFYDEVTLLRPLHRFIRAVIQREAIRSPGSHPYSVYPVHFYRHHFTDLGEESLELRLSSSDTEQLAFFEVRAAAQDSGDGEPLFTLYCGDAEFSELVYGDQVYAAAAQAIQQQRPSGANYPCYLTDLDLSQYQGAEQGFQLAFYLAIKFYLEQRLNASLSDTP